LYHFWATKVESLAPCAVRVFLNEEA
jgi:hypothetical protein